MIASQSKSNRLFRFFACLSIVSVIWLGVLPWEGRLPAVERHIQLMNDNQIDAGAMFYSELAPGVIPDQQAVDEFLRSRTR